MIQIDKPMPEGCNLCPLMYDYIQCNALPEGCKDDDAMKKVGFDWTKRPEWCPLKEQETVEPTINEYGEAYCICGENVGIIPNSKNLPKVCLKYCPECGRRMKWHD